MVKFMTVCSVEEAQLKSKNKKKTLNLKKKKIMMPLLAPALVRKGGKERIKKQQDSWISIEGESL